MDTQGVLHSAVFAQAAWANMVSVPKQGLDYLWAALHQREWVHRRVDSMKMESTNRFVQHTSLDLSVPSAAPRLRDGGGDEIVLLPLFQSQKAPLSKFNIQLGDGTDLPILNAAQTATVSSIGMLAYAQRLFLMMSEVLSYSTGLSDNQETTLRLADLGINTRVTTSVAWPARQTAIQLTKSHIHREPNEESDYCFNQDPRIAGSLPDCTQRVAGCASSRVIQLALVNLITAKKDLARENLAMFARSESPFIRILWETEGYRALLHRLSENYFVTAALSLPGDLRTKGQTRQHDAVGIPMDDAGSLSRHIVVFEVERRRRETRFFNNYFSRFSAASGNSAVWQQIWITFHLLYVWLRRMASKMGVAPSVVITDCSSAGDSSSFHLEFEAPEGMKVTSLVWSLRPRDALGEPRRQLKRSLAVSGPVIQVSPDVRAGVESRTVHSSIAQVPMGYSLNCQIHLRPLTLGWPIWSFVVATPLAVLCWLNARDIRNGWLTRAGEILNLLDEGAAKGSSGDEGARLAIEASLLASETQNRTALLLAAVALGATLLFRTRESPVLTEQLMTARVCVAALATICLYEAFVVSTMSGGLPQPTGNPFSLESLTSPVRFVVGIWQILVREPQETPALTLQAIVENLLTAVLVYSVLLLAWSFDTSLRPVKRALSKLRRHFFSSGREIYWTLER